MLGDGGAPGAIASSAEGGLPMMWSPQGSSRDSISINFAYTFPDPAPRRTLDGGNVQGLRSHLENWRKRKKHLTNHLTNESFNLTPHPTCCLLFCERLALFCDVCQEKKHCAHRIQQSDRKNPLRV